MLHAQLAVFARQGYVEALLFQTFLGRLRLQLRGALRQVVFDKRANLVGQLADDRALFGRELAHLLEDGGYLTFFPKILDAQAFQRLGVACFRQLPRRIRADFLQLLLHCVIIPFKTIKYWDDKQKTPSPLLKHKGRRRKTLRGTTLIHIVLRDVQLSGR